MSIDITIEEMEALPAESYELFDIRGEIERAHGILPNSTASSADVLMENPPEDKEKKIIICCSRGQISRDIAEELQGQGYEAYSLKGGYVGWLMADMKKKEADDVCEHVELSIRKKFKKKIWSKFTKAVREYELVKEGDRIAVCISGGKDSMLMAKLFQELKRHNKFNFEVKFLVMDPGYSPENRKVIEENARKMKIPIQIFESNIFESVFEIEKSPCYICARMRRGYLYNFAQQMGCNKIALGHHYDDVIETILMGMLYSAQVQTMMPKLHSTNFEGMELIRPMYLIREDDIKAWRDYNDLHFIQCACKFTDTCTTCNNEENQSKRMEIKKLIAELKKTNPFVEGNIFKSVENVNLDTVVGYKAKGVHKDRLDHIIKMMSQRNLITSQLLGMRIQITTSHSRTQVTWIILNFCHCIKNITFKNRKRNSQKLCIILNNLPVIRIIARIHYQKHQFKMNLPMTLQLLKQLRHQHRVLTT